MAARLRQPLVEKSGFTSCHLVPHLRCCAVNAPFPHVDLFQPNGARRLSQMRLQVEAITPRALSVLRLHSPQQTLARKRADVQPAGPQRQRHIFMLHLAAVPVWITYLTSTVADVEVFISHWGS
eukprot:6213903-Pleurochrysis_carterae.AAC.2